MPGWVIPPVSRPWDRDTTKTNPQMLPNGFLSSAGLPWLGANESGSPRGGNVTAGPEDKRGTSGNRTNQGEELFEMVGKAWHGVGGKVCEASACGCWGG